MIWLAVDVQTDHLESLVRGEPISGVIELIWTSIDAEAENVRVIVAESPLGGVEEVRVEDDGHGMTRAAIRSKVWETACGRIGPPSPSVNIQPVVPMPAAVCSAPCHVRQAHYSVLLFAAGIWTLGTLGHSPLSIDALLALRRRSRSAFGDVPVPLAGA